MAAFRLHDKGKPELRERRFSGFAEATLLSSSYSLLVTISFFMAQPCAQSQLFKFFLKLLHLFVRHVLEVNKRIPRFRGAANQFIQFQMNRAGIAVLCV